MKSTGRSHGKGEDRWSATSSGGARHGALPAPASARGRRSATPRVGHRLSLPQPPPPPPPLGGALMHAAAATRRRGATSGAVREPATLPLPLPQPLPPPPCTTGLPAAAAVRSRYLGVPPTHLWTEQRFHPPPARRGGSRRPTRLPSWCPARARAGDRQPPPPPPHISRSGRLCPSRTGALGISTLAARAACQALHAGGWGGGPHAPPPPPLDSFPPPCEPGASAATAVRRGGYKAASNARRRVNGAPPRRRRQ